MSQSKVYFADLRASVKENLPTTPVRLADMLGLDQIVPKRGLVAVKLHFGEKGNTAYVRPTFVRRIVERVKSLGACPFLTDSNTLYAGTRSDSVSHLNTAIENGFAFSVVDAPIIIADGLRGAGGSSVKIGQEIVKTAYIGTDIAEADCLISLAHFKGHELSGFGGTIKNLGMGCASRRGKMVQHSDLSPKVTRKKCIGCGECLLICSNGAINVQWNADMVRFQKKMVEYALAALKGKEGRVACLNFLTQISPACDCYGHSDAPIVPDIGILASIDPVAIDQASADMVNLQKGLDGSCLTGQKEIGEDKFRGLYPKVDWTIQLEHGEKIGLGRRDYDLIQI